jgi:hypothetical protein
MLLKDRGALAGFIHIFILVSLASAKPLYVLSRNAEFFVAHNSKPIDIILFLLIQYLCLPLILIGFEIVAGLISRHLYKLVHLFIIASLLSIISMTLLKHINIELSGRFILSFSVIAGCLITLLYSRIKEVRSYFTIFLPAVFIFPYFFVFNSPIEKIVFPEKAYKVVDVEVKNPVPIVMVVFDEFPITSLMDERRMIDPVRYPNFAALATDSYWFRNATAVHESTHYAVPAILTGKYPEKNKLPVVDDYPENIFTLLGKNYDLIVYESITRLCPERLCKGNVLNISIKERTISLLNDTLFVYLHVLLPPVFTERLPVITRSWKDFTRKGVHYRDVSLDDADIFLKSVKDIFQTTWDKEIKGKDRGETFRRFVQLIRFSDKPILYFEHIYLPHIPWSYLPSGKKYSVIEDRINGLKEEHWDDNESFIIEAYRRHLLQVGYVDKLLGELLERLKYTNMYDRSLIIITADHGVSFRPNDSRRGVTKTNYQDIMPVPLFIKLPYQHDGVTSDRNVETIDILPTIAHIIGVSIPWQVDGWSVFDSSRPEREKKVIFFRQTAERKLVLESHLDGKYKTLYRKLELFGSGKDDQDGFRMFRAGPYPYKSLIGHNIDEFNIGMNMDAWVELDNALLYKSVNIKSSFIPAQITGRIRGVKISDLPLIYISVNGILSGVTQTYLDEGKNIRFSTVVPEKVFRNGKNQIEVFLIAGHNNKPILYRIKNKSLKTYKITSSSIASSEGKFYRILKKELKGHLDVVEFKNKSIVLSGWAADANLLHPAEVIVVFANGDFLYSGYCNIKRPDLVKAFKNPQMINAGFSYNIPLLQVKDTTDLEIRVFALSEEGIASELHYPEGDKKGRR